MRPALALAAGPGRTRGVKILAVGQTPSSRPRAPAGRRADSAGRPALRRGALAAVLAAASAAGLAAAELHDETVAAWNLYVAATEQRIAAEIEDGERFLVLDFHEEAARLRREALAGRLVIERWRTLDEQGERFKVPKGAIHHWVGAILVPNAALNDVLDGLQYHLPPHEMQEDVLESRVLARDGDTLQIYLRVKREVAVVSAQYNTEHAVEYVRPGGARAWSRSEATRIAEIDAPGSPDEREKPVGDDRGFLWRMNLYWRYVQVEGGVLVECEALTLSRSTPLLMRWLVSPIVSRESRSAISDTLQSVAEHLGSAVPANANGG